jgi:hypothetical protein
LHNYSANKSGAGAPLSKNGTCSACCEKSFKAEQALRYPYDEIKIVIKLVIDFLELAQFHKHLCIFICIFV